jgi:hypothetical protein
MKMATVQKFEVIFNKFKIKFVFKKEVFLKKKRHNITAVINNKPAVWGTFATGKQILRVLLGNPHLLLQ